MTAQPSLFDPYLRDEKSVAPHNRTETSRAAAEQVVKSGKAETDRRAILAFLVERGVTGATRAEISAELNIPIQSVCGRVHELLGHREGCEAQAVELGGSRFPMTTIGATRRQMIVHALDVVNKETK